MPERRGIRTLLADLLFVRVHHVCPWWFCHAFDNPVRRWLQPPGPVVAPWVRLGDRVLDVGAGMGYFTVPLAVLVGEGGRVVAVDLQREMLDRIVRRARKAGVEDRVETVLSDGRSLGVTGPFDFANVHWMAHEVRDHRAFFAGIAAVVKPGGRLLLVEPRLHVSHESFERIVAAAADAGFSLKERPAVPLSMAALLEKPGVSGRSAGVTHDAGGRSE